MQYGCPSIYCLVVQGNSLIIHDKHDLVRLEDKYGREGNPYEDETHETPKQDDCLWIEEEDSTHKFSNCDIKIENSEINQNQKAVVIETIVKSEVTENVMETIFSGLSLLRWINVETNSATASSIWIQPG